MIKKNIIILILLLLFQNITLAQELLKQQSKYPDYSYMYLGEDKYEKFHRKMFAFNHAGVSPDIMCLSKGLTGGYMPMAIAVTTQKIYDAFYDDYLKGKAFMHSHTYAGNPLACSAAIEVLKILKDENIIAKANEKAVYFNKIIREKFLPLENVGEVRSIGLINAIELVKDRNTKEPLDYRKRTGYQIYKKALKKGVILRPLGDVIYFNPPLIIEKNDMDFVTDVALECTKEVLV